jgi:serine/arginine repetitive matrix protein 2
MVESIQHAQNRPLSPDSVAGSADLSPTSRRKRDLAQALFGQETEEKESSSERDIVQNSEPPRVADPGPIVAHDSLSPSSSTSPALLARSPSMPKGPQTAQQEAQLAQEVQQKITAATLALKRPPVSANLSADPYGQNGSPSRKRISPNQISTPRLVSASTSVEAVPIPRAPSLLSTNSSGPSRIGSRFKKLRGTLRAKNPLLNGDEVTPFPSDRSSSPVVQTAQYDPAKLRAPGGPVTANATESRFKVPMPSPPATAGPGLKGFMARLRGKQRVTADTASESGVRSPPLLPSTPTSTHSESVPPRPQLAPKPIQAVSSTSTLRATRQSRSAPAAQTPHESAEQTKQSETTALQQLFDAANNLGLDQGALNDLLARSTSTSSRATEWTKLTRNNSSMGTPATAPADSSRLPPTTGIDDQSVRTETPDPKASEHTNGRHSTDNQSLREDPMTGQPSVRKPAGHLRRPREGQSDSRATSAIIKRTIIYPSESKASPIDLSAVTRKNSNRRKRASASSISSRSVQDRAPTPPPSRSPTSKRFSNSPSPPVPHLPTSLTAQADNLLTVPSMSAGGSIEKSNSTYDSL